MKGMKKHRKNYALVNAREASGKTQAQVAAEAHICERIYQNYEYGTEPRVTTAMKIATVLNSDVQSLWGSKQSV